MVHTSSLAPHPVLVEGSRPAMLLLVPRSHCFTTSITCWHAAGMIPCGLTTLRIEPESPIFHPPSIKRGACHQIDVILLNLYHSTSLAKHTELQPLRLSHWPALKASYLPALTQWRSERACGLTGEDRGQPLTYPPNLLCSHNEAPAIPPVLGSSPPHFSDVVESASASHDH